MQLVCPSCGFFGPPDAYLAEGAESRGILLALSAPAALAQPIQQYLRLFRPQQRALSSRRVVTLLEELLPMILEAKITWRGVVYPAPVEYWREAMDEMIVGRDRLDLPMKSHGYLLTIIAGYAKRADAASEVRANQTRAGATPIGTSAAHQPFAAEKPAQQPRTSRTATAAGLQSLRAVLDGAPIPTPAGRDAGATGEHHE